MHDQQVDTDAEQVRRLLCAQQPQWADLPIQRIATSGTDNAIYRLGDDLVIRMPLIYWAVDQVPMEHEWLPRLAAVVPVDVHEPVALGEPGEGYPWRWSVYRWIEAENAHHDHLADPVALAGDIADVVLALRSMPTEGMPRSVRGRPLDPDAETIRDAIERVRPELGDDEADVLREAWEAALAAPHWRGPFRAVHGDLSGNNLLLGPDGRLRAIIDWSCFGLGEPANDLDVAWELFSGESRGAYRDALDVDDATWARGRGWAIKAVYGIPYYRDTNPGIVERARRRLANVIDEYSS